MGTTRRPRRMWPILIFVFTALTLGYLLSEAAHSTIPGNLLDASANLPASGGVEKATSAAKAKNEVEAPAAETSGKLSTPAKEDASEAPERAGTSSPPQDTCDDLMVLVDREHQLPPDYAPRDLVSVEASGVPVYGGEMLLRRGATEQLVRMTRAANAAGQELMVSSAYRSYAQQGTAFARLISIYGMERARWTSAPPGQSQHQLGTAVDFTNSYVGYEIHKSFGDTTASAWLMEHASEYGFVLSYPNHMETETGYRWEPWHYRYVGVDNASQLRESGATLQSFLAREGVEPHC